MHVHWRIEGPVLERLSRSCRIRVVLMRHYVLIAVAVIFFLLCSGVPVSAAVPEMTYKGQVSTMIPAKNILSIKTPEQYGCDYPSTGDSVCNWTPLSKYSLTATVPDPAAFTVFSGAESVIATNMGGDGGKWITLAKVYGSRETEQLVTDVVGDPGTLVLPLIGDYSVETEMIPECNACSGTICDAAKTIVTVRSAGKMVQEETITPGESFTFNGRNDGSAVMVRFISGEAAAQSCPGKTGLTGPQPRSVFVIKVTPPAGYGQVNIRTATTTRPDEVLTTITVAGTAPVVSGTVTQAAASSVETPEASLSGYLVPVSLLCAVLVILRSR